MTRVLLTGFEPFDGHPVNASWDAVALVRDAWADPDVDLVVRRLPVSFRRARQDLRSAIAELSPDVVVCVGEAGGRGAVGLERVAVNVIDARIPDADGSAPVDVPVIAGAPAAFFSSLPVKACAAAVAQEGVPVEVSNTAGTYVCNATFYALAHLLESRDDVRGGFVHVPRDPREAGDGPGLPVEDSARAVAAVVRTAARVHHDVRVTAGAEA
ncbi:pyroglutamyl-peptidase I [Cellulomonas fimi]|uniref:pyroglutamyl-peptidase I n=1 Tax=Cellulomonas fimi TaxID=1708 RepID=UPI00234CE03D|nr:pyroglutamyl-peptidase I [Cellulomonas fimi]MDC7122078.1 pyroglutamyl-peptidase I [Cellulomonas fimi]